MDESHLSELRRFVNEGVRLIEVAYPNGPFGTKAAEVLARLIAHIGQLPSPEQVPLLIRLHKLVMGGLLLQSDGPGIEVLIVRHLLQTDSCTDPIPSGTRCFLHQRAAFALSQSPVPIEQFSNELLWHQWEAHRFQDTSQQEVRERVQHPVWDFCIQVGLIYLEGKARKQFRR